MYGVPQNLESLPLAGTSLSQLSLGPHIVHFIFDSGHQITAEGKVEVMQDDAVVAVWDQSNGWSSIAYQSLFRIPVSRCLVPNSKLFVIAFKGGLALHIHDSSEQFESFSVHPGDIYV